MRSNACWPTAIDAPAAADDLDAIRRATEALIAGTDDFAARRMDRSIRAALAGRTVEELAK